MQSSCQKHLPESSEQLVKNRCGDWNGLFQNVNIIKDKTRKRGSE